jgi:hypothetical protein
MEGREGIDKSNVLERREMHRIREWWKKTLQGRDLFGNFSLHESILLIWIDTGRKWPGYIWVKDQ